MNKNQDISGCLKDHIGSFGLTNEEFSHWKKRAEDALRHLPLTTMAPLTITWDQDDLPPLLALAEKLREKFSTILVFGTGGSSLGGQTLSRLAPTCPHSPRKLAKKVRVRYVDNIDPDTFAGLFKGDDLKNTGVIVISKSGETAETLMQMIYALQVYEEGGLTEEISQHFYGITEDKPSSMTQLAKAYSIPLLPHHPQIGGRFSIFSNVALLPAFIEGVDGAALRKSAAASLELALQAPQDHPAMVGAAVTAGLSFCRGIQSVVVMPYLDKMSEFGLWYRQLWAESLGKMGKGMTPLLSMGTVDQHSQLQLYLDGPRDKLFTLFMPEPHHRGSAVSSAHIPSSSLNFLKGRTMGDLLIAEAQATATTLMEKGCPTRCFTLGPYGEESLGSLLMHFMLETLITAALWEVDPWTQPAVERGKLLTREFMARHHESSHS
jgi:glucose-6-phosphate isomerase